MTCTKFLEVLNFLQVTNFRNFFFHTFCLIFLWNMPFSLLWNRTEHCNFWLLFFLEKILVYVVLFK